MPASMRLRLLASPAAPADRCLNPQCAAHKGKLYVDRMKVELAGRHGNAPAVW